MRAEVKVATMLVANIPLALADELTLLLQDIFSDSEIAKNYSSRRTKTACIINGAVVPFFQQNFVEHTKKNLFSFAIDGSSDNDIEKMNPLTVQLFDVNCGNVGTQFLDMCMSSSSTAEGIFSKMDDAFTTRDISWDNCVGLSRSGQYLSQYGLQEFNHNSHFGNETSDLYYGLPLSYCTQYSTKSGASFRRGKYFNVRFENCVVKG